MSTFSVLITNLTVGELSKIADVLDKHGLDFDLTKDEGAVKTAPLRAPWHEKQTRVRGATPVKVVGELPEDSGDLEKEIFSVAQKRKVALRREVIAEVMQSFPDLRRHTVEKAFLHLFKMGALGRDD